MVYVAVVTLNLLYSPRVSHCIKIGEFCRQPPKSEKWLMIFLWKY